MKSAKVTYLLQSGRIIGRCSSGIGRFGRKAGPRIQMAGMSPWSSSSSLDTSSSSCSCSCSCLSSSSCSSSCCGGGGSSSSGEGDLARGPLVLLLLLPLLVVCDSPQLVEAPTNLPHPSSFLSSLQPSGRTHLSQ